MVVGLQKFIAHFADYTDRYIIIGGTACDLLLENTAIVARRTTDIDLILAVEAYDADFVRHFWSFIDAGKYAQLEESAGEKQHYRFTNPAIEDFPYQLELFSRKSDVLKYEGIPRFTPLPLAEEVSSLSAILMDDNYYPFTVSHSTVQQGARIANREALICLKAKAWLDLGARKAAGEDIDKRKVNKHRSDIFRLGLLLTPDERHEVPTAIQADMLDFAQQMHSGGMPDKAILKEMGAPAGLKSEAILTAILTAFNMEL